MADGLAGSAGQRTLARTAALRHRLPWQRPPQGVRGERQAGLAVPESARVR
ncbi:hypothetical protein ACFZAV_27720 [Streptomyces sp. NPDC008343]|uniref:hypothetical protein n=1 Tax=Streptomyces sp. NPDC008343 TaxID=3364828 RepID=UPI0036E6BEA3